MIEKKKYIAPEFEMFYLGQIVMKTEWSTPDGGGPGGNTSDDWAKEGDLRYDDVYNQDDPNTFQHHNPWED